MEVKILFLGDIFGRPGREIVKKRLPELRKEHGIDFVFANGENAAHGFGLTRKITKELTALGIDALTTGNHLWDQKCFLEEIKELDNVCIPANMPPDQPGARHLIIEKNGIRIALFCILGHDFIKEKTECPFRTSEQILKNLGKKCDAIVVDMHAETTAEKMAFGWFMDGKASLVVGTHTHIPTADARILPNGTGYITDTGMCGAYDSILGCKKEPIVQKFFDGIPRKFEVAEKDKKIAATLATISSKKTTSIQLIFD